MYLGRCSTHSRYNGYDNVTKEADGSFLHKTELKVGRWDSRNKGKLIPFPVSRCRCGSVTNNYPARIRQSLGELCTLYVTCNQIH